MIAWKRIEAGEYESVDERFYILKAYDRVFGNHWILHDNHESDYYKRQYHEYSLKECKLKAETIAKNIK